MLSDTLYERIIRRFRDSWTGTILSLLVIGVLVLAEFTDALVRIGDFFEFSDDAPSEPSVSETKSPPFILRNKQKTYENLLSFVIAALSRLSGVAQHEIGIDTSFVTLGLDSLDEVELVMAIERDMRISIPDDAAVNWRNVRDVVSSLEKYGQELGGTL
jgi:acyl carrier protein